MTDHQSQQRINEAAEQFTDALVQSYKVVAERGVSARKEAHRLPRSSSTKLLTTCVPRPRRTARRRSG